MKSEPKFEPEPEPEPKSENIDSLDTLTRRVSHYRWLYMIVTVSSCTISLSALPNISYVKDDLDATPAQLTLFSTLTRLEALVKPLIGYIEDKYSPFGGYKIKFFITLSSLCLIVIYFLIWIAQPGIELFCLLMIIKGISSSIGDSMAQGMTAMTLKYQQQISRMDPSQKVEEGLNFGYQQIVKNLIMMICGYVGGSLAGKVYVGEIYMWMMTIPVLTLLYTFIIFREDTSYNVNKKIVENQTEDIIQTTEVSVHNRSVKEKLVIVWSIFKKDEMKYPLVIMLLSALVPQLMETQLFILTDESLGGWSYTTVALNSLFMSSLYTPIMMVILPKILKKKITSLIFFSTVCYSIAAFFLYFLSYIDRINFYLMVGIQITSGVFASFGYDLNLIPIVGKYSSMSPKGLENFGLTVLNMLFAAFSIAGSALSSPLLDVLNIGENSYDNLTYLIMIIFCARIFVMLAVPILLR